MSPEASPGPWWAKLEGWRAASVWGLIATVALRLGLGLTMAMTWITVKPHLAVGLLDNPKTFGALHMPISSPADALLGVWARWDAIHHLNLALLGYSGVPVGDTVFYPLYALLARAVAGLLGGDAILGGLIVSTLAAWASFAGLYRLADSLFGASTARWSVLVLACFPTSVFLVAPFTESLFLALTVGAFLACYRGRWWLAGVLGFLASLTRGPGMISALAFVIIAWDGWRKTKGPFLSYWGAPILAGVGLPLAGGVSFLAWREAAGFPAAAKILRQYSGLVLTNPASGLLASVQQWIRAADFTMTLEVLTALLFIGLTSVMFINPRWRKPEWLAYVAANLCLFLSKQSLTGSSLQSLPRYVLTLFPVFVVMGDWLAQRSRRAQFVYVTGSSSILLVFGVLYVLWVFIG